MTISFLVEGEPKGQPRPRAFARNGMVRVYDPATAEGWKNQIAIAFRQEVLRLGLKTDGDALFNGPVKLQATFVFQSPKSHFNAKGVLKQCWRSSWKVSKPDLDNIEKALMDALTTCRAWDDDSQVCAKQTRKVWVDDLIKTTIVTIEGL